MMRTVPLLLAMLATAPALVAWAWTCPVPELPNSYFMLEGYAMTSMQAFYTPFVSSQDDNITWPEPLYVKPQCVDIASKALNMQTGQWDVASFTSDVGGTGFATAQSSSACTGDIMFNVVYSQFGFHVLDAELECLAEVTAQENLDNNFTVRTCNHTKVLGTATKKLKDGNLVVPFDRTYPAYAVWTVTVDAAMPSPYIMPYLVGIRDNSGLRCPVATGSPAPATVVVAPAAGMPTGAVVGLALGCSVIVGIVIGFVLRMVPPRANYAAIREAINENHEA